MAVDVNSALNRAYEELRNIDLDLSALSGVQDRFSTRKRSATDSGNVTNAPSDRAKRTRHDDDLWNEQQQHNRYPQRDYSPPSSRPQRTLSSVIMSSTSVASTIETKSRTAVITEKKKNETKEDAVRNRRLFSNLLVGTLRQFQKEEKTVGVKGQAQLEKQREVERRLEENEKENRERLLRERDSLMEKRRDKEMQIQALRRQKAIEQSSYN
uniref:Pinin_SDK_memA domain-containing protein n=1 Tax=Meloidogyne hapla TaxID=6305 RepID=A0A1I8BDD7_MELHA